MKVNVDIMTHFGERFYRTVRYDYNPLFRMDMKEVEDYVFANALRSEARRVWYWLLTIKAIRL